MSAARRGGVVVRVGEELAFVPADVALRVAEAPRVARVAGAPVALRGLTLFEGAVLPVVAVSDHGGAMLVCLCAGERVGLVGLDVVATGVFDVDPSDETRVVLQEGEEVRRAPRMHVEDVLVLLQGTRWVGRA